MPGAVPDVEPAPPAAWRPLGASFLELLGITGLAFAQPIFDLLSRNDSLFVVWGTRPLELVLLAVTIVLVPAVALILIEIAARLAGERVRVLVHRGLIAVVAAVLAVEALKRYTGLATAALLVSAAAVFALAVVVVRFDPVRMWLRFLAIAPLLFALLFVFASGATPVAFEGDPPLATVTPDSPSRVVFVVLDELPLASLLDGAGEIDETLYPHLAALSRETTWYRNTSTVSAFTETAVPALLTGRYPADSGDLPFVSQYPENLFTLLGGTYDLHVREAVTRLCPTSTCPRTRAVVNLHSGFTGMLQDTSTIWRDFASPFHDTEFTFEALGAADVRALGTADRFIRGLTPTEEPRLDFLHVLAPHFPWHYLPTGQDYVAFPAHSNGFVDGQWGTQIAGDAARVRHLLQAQAVDGMIGSLVARLRAIDAYDDTLLVVTADHGAAFDGQRPFRGVAADTWPEVMWTPLFVKAPGQSAGTADDRPAQSIDVLPTIADHLGIDLPWPVDGRSLLDPPIAADADVRRLLDAPEHTIDPEAGQRLLEFDGAAGFASVIDRQATAQTPDDPLRTFRVGTYGARLGDDAADYVIAEPAGLEGTIDRLPTYGAVSQFSSRFPWATLHGTVASGETGIGVAVALNGRLAVITETQDLNGSDDTVHFWGVLPPALFAFGPNELALYAISGPADAPTLRPIPITPTPLG